MASQSTRPLLKAPGRCRRCQRTYISSSRFYPQPPLDPHRRLASTTTATTKNDWLKLDWLKPSFLRSESDTGGKALMFAGLVSHPSVNEGMS